MSSSVCIYLLIVSHAGTMTTFREREREREEGERERERREGESEREGEGIKKENHVTCYYVILQVVVMADSIIVS
jgi:hypothetical protein